MSSEQLWLSFSFLQTLINMAYCCLILLGKSIQKIVFGELRISEQQVSESHRLQWRQTRNLFNFNILMSVSLQHMKDKFWNFIFYKFIFVFGIVNVQYLHEIVLWVSWFSALGFLHIMAQLCKDRFEYVSWMTCSHAEWSLIVQQLSTIEIENTLVAFKVLVRASR